MSTTMITAPAEGKDATAASLAMAAEANMFVLLHVKDGCGNGLLIPMNDLLTKKGQSKVASYTALRRLALAALFKHEEVPEYAHKNFQTRFTCSLGGARTLMRNDDDLTNMLEEASTYNLMDDNDDIVVDIHCTFVNTYRFDTGDVILENTIAAADNARKAVKTWVGKASNVIQRFVTDDDYVVVKKKQTKENTDPVEWATRFVQFLFADGVRVPSKKRPRPGTKPASRKRVVVPQKPKETPLQTAEDMLDVAVVGFTLATNLINEAFVRQEEALHNFFNKRAKRARACQTSPLASLSSTSSSKASLSSEEEDDFNLDRGVEIEFDPENENNELTEDEWKIFFSNSSDENEAVVLDIPSEQDVISISSEESIVSAEGASVSDDDSWAVLDDE